METDLPESTGAPVPLSEQDERLWAMLAHLSILLNLVTGFLGVVAAIVIYAVYKDRSRSVGFHALQSFFFQLVFFIGAGIIAAVAWMVSGLLSVFIIGLACLPLAALISLIPIGAAVYGIYGGVQAYQGQEFRYWLVADWVQV